MTSSGTISSIGTAGRGEPSGPAPATDATDHTRTPDTDSARAILIVGDERIVQMHLRRVVAAMGHDVIGSASTAAAALEACEKRPPELVLMDIHLAQGDDGVDLAKILCGRYGCSVIFVTAYADDATISRTSSVNAAGYIVKPFTTTEVRAAVSTALNAHGRLEQARARGRSLESALVNLSDPVIVTDLHGRVTFANPKGVELMGRGPSESRDADLFDVVKFSTDSDAVAVRAMIADSVAGGEPRRASHLQLTAPNGSEHTVSVQIEPLRGDGGEITGSVLRLPATEAIRHAPRRQRRKQTGSFGPGTRLLVYSHDTFGLGHLRRSLKLIHALVARYPGLSVLLVTGSPLIHRYELPEGVDYVKLPAIRKVGAESYEARSLSMSRDDIRNLRSNLLLRAVRDYDPSVLLVDHSPTGSTGELRPALEWLSEQQSCVRILGLRDVLDSPETVAEVWEAQGIHDVLRDLYDHVVVYGSRDVYDPVERYGLGPEIAAKTHFMNYVTDPPSPVEKTAAASDASTERDLVAVSIGGGDGGAEAVIGTLLDMMEKMRDRIDFHAEILTGPFISRELEARFIEQARDLPVTLTALIPSTADLYRKASVVVSTAGYNTVTDLLSYARRAVLIPRILHRQEQLIRAKRLEEMGLVRCLHPDEITPELLFEAIQNARLSQDEPLTQAREKGTVAIDGAESLVKFCETLRVPVIKDPDSPDA